MHALLALLLVLQPLTSLALMTPRQRQRKPKMPERPLCCHSYLDTCPGMSIFLAGALYALAFGMLLPSLMVIGLQGLQAQKWLPTLYAPTMHMGASMLVGQLQCIWFSCILPAPLLLSAYCGPDSPPSGLFPPVPTCRQSQTFIAMAAFLCSPSFLEWACSM